MRFGNIDSPSNQEYKIVTFQRDTSTATGTQNVTGVGFKPSKVILIASVSSAAGQGSFGFDDGTNHCCIADLTPQADNYWLNESSYSIWLTQALSVYYKGYISAMGSDGFTVSWEKSGAKTGTVTVFALCFK